MENLLDLIRSCLRKGDIASRCSVSQFILMRPRPTTKTAAWSASGSSSPSAGSIPTLRPSCIIPCSLWNPTYKTKKTPSCWKAFFFSKLSQYRPREAAVSDVAVFPKRKSLPGESH